MNKRRSVNQKFFKQDKILRVCCQKGYPIQVVRVSAAKILDQASVHRQTSTSNAKYKRCTYLYSPYAEYEELDQVMVCVRPEHFPNDEYKKIKKHDIGPYKILHKINSNIYVLDLPEDEGISKIFNSEDLTLYRGRTGGSSYNAPAGGLTSNFCDEIEDIVDTKIVSTRSGGYQKYLVKWKNREWSDCSWICDDDFQSLDCDLYGKYHSFSSSKPCSFKRRRNESDISGRFGKHYRRKCNHDSQAKESSHDRLKIEKFSSHAPQTGIRYDGIYRVEKCWLKVCNQGYKVWRYLFIRCDNEPAPWTSDDRGDRPRPLPYINELKNATNIGERIESPSWDYDGEKESWMWKKPPPATKKRAAGLSHGETRKTGCHTQGLTVGDKLLKEFSCPICRKVMAQPLTTPCAHNFCKPCLEGAFSGQTFVRQRKFEGWRTLRAQKNILRCPSCSSDISDFLQNPQVNRELMNVVKLLQRQSKIDGKKMSH